MTVRGMVFGHTALASDLRALLPVAFASVVPGASPDFNFELTQVLK